MISGLVSFFQLVMDGCHVLIPNWWWDIVLFTLLSKVLQYPLSLWCHANALKMVSIMPATLRCRIDCFGDREMIGEKTAELYRRKKCRPILALLPLGVQILFLVAFIRVVKGIAVAHPASLLGAVPWTDGGLAWCMPALAGLSAAFLGWAQNRIHPLQREQGRASQLATNGVSVALSLFLGAFVEAGVGLYWIASNVFSVAVQLACNRMMRPERHVDYEALRKVQAELHELESSVRTRQTRSREDRRREAEDYRRFFRVANKHLVFYSESSGFYRYFRSIVEWLLEHTNLTVHYVTNDPNDIVFRRETFRIDGIDYAERVRAYYVGPLKTIPLMMRMDADMVVMTTPDLGTYQLKRSLVRKDVEYVYLDHAPASVQMTYRKGAFDHFDTIFANGQYQIDEHRATERTYGLRPKKMVPTGYALLDDLFANYRPQGKTGSRTVILVAPSHQPGNLFEDRLDELVGLLRRPDREIRLRPHPQYTRRFPERMRTIAERYAECSDVTVELDFSKNDSVYEADVLITDWSGIAYEYAFTTRRPVVFVNTPMKVVNPEYGKIGLTPTNITFRDLAGVSLDPGELDKLSALVDRLLANPNPCREKIAMMLDRYFFNPGYSGAVAGRYIVDSIIAHVKGRKQ